MNLCTYHIPKQFVHRTEELTYLGFAKEFATIAIPLLNDNIMICTNPASSAVIRKLIWESSNLWCKSLSHPYFCADTKLLGRSKIYTPLPYMVMDSTIMNKYFDVYSPTGPLRVIEYATFSILKIKIAQNTGDKNPFVQIAKPAQNLPHLLSM
jgi:hypothetical protein